MTQEIRCGEGSCERLVAKIEGANLLVKCPRCGTWREIPIAQLVSGMAMEFTACTHDNGTAPQKRIFL